MSLDGVRNVRQSNINTDANQVTGGGGPTSENTVFNKQVRKALVEENAFNLDKKTIKLIEKMDGGEEFLLKIANLQDSDADVAGFQLETNKATEMKKEAINFFKADQDTEVNVGTQALLSKFGVTENDYSALVDKNYLEKVRPETTLKDNNGNSLGNIRYTRMQDGTIKLYNAESGREDDAVAELTCLNDRTQLYVDENTSARFKFNNGAFINTSGDLPTGLISENNAGNDQQVVSNQATETSQEAISQENATPSSQKQANVAESQQNTSDSVSRELSPEIATRAEDLGFQVDDGFKALTPEDQTAKLNEFEQWQKQDAEIDAKAEQLGYTPGEGFADLEYEQQKEFLDNLERNLNQEINDLQTGGGVPLHPKDMPDLDKMTLSEKRDYLRDRIQGQKDLINNAKEVTINESGSTQRLTKDEEWTTGVKISSEKLDNGLPARISIQLPDEYGTVGPDGKKQVRYQSLHFDAETGFYSDKNKVRQFQLLTTENGIVLQQVDPQKASAGVKSFLDKNVNAVQEKTAELVQKENNSHKMDVQKKTSEQAKVIMDLLSDRNNSWEIYTQAGSEVGYLTGANGLLEELVDESQVTGIKTFKDLKPAIDGLMARVPQTRDMLESPEYKAVQKIIKGMEQTPDAELKTNFVSDFAFKGGTVRDLDEAMMNLAKLMATKGHIQGANHANNSFLVGGRGSVIITPTREHGMWKTDAQFRFAGDDAVYEMHSGGVGQGGRTIDFQDLVEHKDDGKLDKLSLIRNNITGDNRHGEIKFDVNRAKNLTNLRFNDGTNSYPIKVEVNDAGEIVGAFVYSPDGKNKVPIDDLLNGRVKMPQNVPAET